MSKNNESTVLFRLRRRAEKNEEDEPLPVTLEDRKTIATFIEQLALLLKSAASEAPDAPALPRHGYFVKLHSFAPIVSAEAGQVSARTRLFSKQIQLRRVLRQLQKTHEPVLRAFILLMREALSKTGVNEIDQPLQVEKPHDFLSLCEDPQTLADLGPKALNQVAACYERLAQSFVSKQKAPLESTTSYMEEKSGH